ncbi:MAG: heavy metal-associated domain-containing protein, partial [Abditibacteriaceae bacterium]
MYNKKVKSLITKTLLGTALGITTGFVAMSTTGTSALAATTAPAKQAMTAKPAMHAIPAKKAMSSKKAMSHSAHRDALFATGKFDSASIEKALKGQPGIITMNANSKNKHVWVQYDPSKTTSEKLESALKKAGVKPEAIQTSSHSKMKKHHTMKKHTSMKKSGAVKKSTTKKVSTTKKSSAKPAKKIGAKTTTKKATTTKTTTSP